MLHPPRLDPRWYAAPPERAIEPGRRIIDAHFHFSDHWAGYGLDDQLRDAATGHRIDATVFMQVGWKYRTDGPEHLRPVGETEAVVSLAEQAASREAGTRVAAGIVGYADLRLGDAAAEVLEAHVEAGKGRFRGVRCSAARHESFRFGVLPRPPVGLYSEPAFRAGLRRLAAMDLVFDAWIYHPQLQEVIDLARAVPEATIVLDHVGGILGAGAYAGRRDEAFAEWLASIRTLASCPNVVVKIGGYGIATFGFQSERLPEPPSSAVLAEHWRPSAEVVIEAFGANRCMFESNFPVDRSSGNYSTVWNAFKRIAAHATEGEKDDLFAGTAARVYRIVDR
ncbi:amidohydrolase family protein [Bordetella genomosp. 13]|uniref:amidohydrolase family protein n=1 Tax=Bordetella genomosp. 13 TaxID=463040 RepID=UPI0021B53099|nr:amidohydrolase family protein [Bordetella genomosp. 13]